MIGSSLPGCIGNWGNPTGLNGPCRSCNHSGMCAVTALRARDFSQGTLVCPVCGFEYVHPIAVKVATGENLTSIDNDGVRVVNSPLAECGKASSARGVRIFLEYRCEAGHHGNIILQFHKGSTHIEHELLPSTTEWATLWRT